MKNITFSLIIALTLKTSTSFAWGKVGHTMVAEIALAYLNKGVKDSIQKYLGKMTFGEAGTWMDDVRYEHKYDYMKPWHYVNVEKDKTYVKNTEENAVNQIEKAIAELGNKSKLTAEQINTDLKVLFHLVGDLHMPLHCGYGEDKGGNTIDVEINGQSANLHSSWDTKIIESRLSDVQKGVTELCKKLTVADKKKFEKIDVEAWVMDSRGYLPEIYSFKKGELNNEYIDKSLPIIEKQLMIAGLRLANVLNEDFKK